MKAVGEPMKTGDTDPIRPKTMTTPSKEKGHGTEEGDGTSIGISMYHSAVGSLFGGQDKQRPPDIKGGSLRRSLTRRSLPDLAQRLLVASEKQISAKFSIAEVLLSLSSRGEMECGVGGLAVERREGGG